MRVPPQRKQIPVTSSAVAIPERKKEDKSAKNRKPKRQPRYHVVLWDDNDHTFAYVIRMLQGLFGLSAERGFELAKTVDTHGRVICLTTTREHAELKQEQIHAFGGDPLVKDCAGAMYATIEPAESE